MQLGLVRFWVTWSPCQVCCSVVSLIGNGFDIVVYVGAAADVKSVFDSLSLQLLG